MCLGFIASTSFCTFYRRHVCDRCDSLVRSSVWKNRVDNILVSSTHVQIYQNVQHFEQSNEKHFHVTSCVQFSETELLTHKQ